MISLFFFFTKLKAFIKFQTVIWHWNCTFMLLLNWFRVFTVWPVCDMLILFIICYIIVIKSTRYVLHQESHWHVTTIIFQLPWCIFVNIDVLMPMIINNSIYDNSMFHDYEAFILYGYCMLCKWTQPWKQQINLGIKKRDLLMPAHTPKPSTTHARCIVTWKEATYIFLWFWFLFFFFLFLSHFSSVSVSHWRPTNVCVRGFAMSSWKKRPTVCWEKEAFLPGTLFILCLCGNITDFALFHCICPTLPTSRYFAYKIHPNKPSDQAMQWPKLSLG